MSNSPTLIPTQTNSPIGELKPCPFCGGKAKVKVCDGSGAYYTDIGTEMYHGRKMTHCLIRCERCRVRTQAYLTRRGVFNAWNRRTNNEQRKVN